MLIDEKNIRELETFEEVLKNDEYIREIKELIYVYKSAKEEIKQRPKPRKEEDFAEMMRISGEIGGLRRLKRQRILLLITEYFLLYDDLEVSARSIRNLQNRYFKRSVDNIILNKIYGEESRGPGDRVDKIFVDEKKLKAALKYWKIYSKTIIK